MMDVTVTVKASRESVAGPPTRVKTRRVDGGVAHYGKPRDGISEALAKKSPALLNASV